MIDQKLHLVKFDKAEDLLRIREIQRELKLIIPSDYVHFLMNYNNLIFDEAPFIEYGGDKQYGEFYKFNNLDELYWKYVNTRKSEVAISSFTWTREYLNIADTHCEMEVLIGNDKYNSNKIYYLNKEDNEIIPIADNLYEYINHFLGY